MEKKTQQFKAEIAEMLDLVVNSLYSKKEIFLRELISNASDAIDRAKFLSLTDKALVADNPEWKIQIAADKGAKTLMISDNGIGMDAAEHACRRQHPNHHQPLFHLYSSPKEINDAHILPSPPSICNCKS